MPKLIGSLDANIIVRLLTNDIPEKFSSALRLLTEGGEFEIADVALIETIYALHNYYEVPRKEVREIVNDLFTNMTLRVDRSVFGEALAMYELHPALSIEDCYLSILAKHKNALPLWTFEKKLAHQSDGLAQELTT